MNRLQILRSAVIELQIMCASKIFAVKFTMKDFPPSAANISYVLIIICAALFRKFPMGHEKECFCDSFQSGNDFFINPILKIEDHPFSQAYFFCFLKIKKIVHSKSPTPIYQTDSITIALPFQGSPRPFSHVDNPAQSGYNERGKNYTKGSEPRPLTAARSAARKAS